jgi:nitrate/nitrite transporter NarK
MIEAARVGAVGGYVHMFGNFAGVASPIITGFIVQRTGSFASAFALAGVIALLGSICIALFVSNQPRERELALEQRRA